MKPNLLTILVVNKPFIAPYWKLMGIKMNFPENTFIICQMTQIMTVS